MDSINVKSLYRIVNRAIAKIDNHSDEPVNKEMQLFKERYVHYISNNPPQHLFDERHLLVDDVTSALDFCDALYAYQQATDVDSKDSPVLSESNCRILLKGIDTYKEHILPENKTILEIIKNSAKRRLPEFKDQYLLEEYYNEALFVIAQKKKYQKARKNGKSQSKAYERYALHFYEKITQDEEMKRVKPCLKKVELYTITLDIIDYLPKEKYNRSTKFMIKSQLWFGIAKSLSILDDTKVEEIKKARGEAMRYAKAAENALTHATNYDVVASVRNKRQQEEWLYR